MQVITWGRAQRNRLRMPGCLARGALNQLPQQAVDIADKHVARAVCADDGLAAGAGHGAAGLGPLIDGCMDIAHHHRESGRSRVFGASHQFRARHAGILDQPEVQSGAGNVPVRDSPVRFRQANQFRYHWIGSQRARWPRVEADGVAQEGDGLGGILNGKLNTAAKKIAGRSCSGGGQRIGLLQFHEEAIGVAHHDLAQLAIRIPGGIDGGSPDSYDGRARSLYFRQNLFDIAHL